MDDPPITLGELASEALDLVRRAKELADDLELFAMSNEATSVLAHDGLRGMNDCMRSLTDMLVHADLVDRRGLTHRPEESPRSQDMLFEVEDGDAKPCLPVICGKRLEADGVRFFSVPQAMRRFGLPRKRLEKLWLDRCASVWAGILPTKEVTRA